MVKLPKRLKIETLSQNGADKGFSTNRRQSEQMIRLFDPADNRAWGYVVIDDTRRGAGLGGVRMARDVTLHEVQRLARAMTLKNSVSQLPFGGGKAGLVVDPESANDRPGFKAELFELFAEAVYPLSGYIPAPDMGTDERDMQVIHDFFSRQLGSGRHMRGGAGRPPDRGGIPIDAWGLTAHGLFAAAKTLEDSNVGLTIKNARVVIQGYGNVGSPTATKLYEAGAVIVGASDIHAGLWSPGGLDVEQMNSIRHQHGGLANYSGRADKRFSSGNLDRLLEAPCDILIPAARPDAITSRNADRIDCRFILQGANTPSNKMTEYYLQNRRDILSLSDFVVNVGGVIGCAAELVMNTDDRYKSMVSACGGKTYLENLIFSTVSRNVSDILQRLREAKRPDTIFREEALSLAEERLRQVDKHYWM
ncbi:MAG: Glu/Leu/Phe/Val dehydrogenase [Nitrospinales bacterium]